MKRLLLCTDLDRTLVPNGAGPESPEARGRFRRLAARDEVTLAYVSGRSPALIERAIGEFGLPPPDFAIADVGTTICRALPSGWQRDEAWDARIAQEWQGAAHGEVVRLLGVFPELRLQEKEKQTRHKASFYVPPEADIRILIDGVGERLRYAGIRASLVWSFDEVAHIGLLDVLPAGAGKLSAIRFLMQQNGFLPGNTLFAGDSGNDLDVLTSGIPAVLVANAAEDVRGLAERAGQAACYVARGGYLGMNGNYSAGILEGVVHHFPETDAWLRGAD